MNGTNNQLTLGGKGTGLVWLTKNTDLGFEVPEFEIIGTSFYEQALASSKTNNQLTINFAPTQALEDKCRVLSERFNGRSIAVRSSGVISEDSDKHSGAGIHDTFFLGAEELNKDTILEAVLKVYASVNNERAIRYRQEFNLGEENLAVIVQEKVDGKGYIHGVFQSRLQAVSRVIPVFWSKDIGAVVGSATLNEAENKSRKYTIYCKNKGIGKINDCLYISEPKPSDREQQAAFDLVCLILKLKERYGIDFEAEFAKDINTKKVYMLQIRPLTNISDKTISFPNKTPIFSGKLCMGAGEYIGPWLTPADLNIRNLDNENTTNSLPPHYAFVSGRLDQTITTAFGGLSGINPNVPKDYDKLTPNKRAIVITDNNDPGMHALTIANEKGILCVAGLSEELSKGELERETRLGQYEVYSLGLNAFQAVASQPKFKIPLKEVGKYIHVVTDGLDGHVYQATEEEARAFEKNMLASVEYDISTLSNRWDEMDNPYNWWEWSLKIRAPNPVVYKLLFMDFINHIETKSGKQFNLVVEPPTNVYYELHHPNCEFEVYCAYNNGNTIEGIKLETGRSAPEIADKETTRQWFQEFADRVKSPDYFKRICELSDELW